MNKWIIIIIKQKWRQTRGSNTNWRIIFKQLRFILVSEIKSVSLSYCSWVSDVLSVEYKYRIILLRFTLQDLRTIDGTQRKQGRDKIAYFPCFYQFVFCLILIAWHLFIEKHMTSRRIRKKNLWFLDHVINYVYELWLFNHVVTISNSCDAYSIW